MELGLYELGSILGGIGNYLQFQDLKLEGIKTDSRMIQPGDVFVCLEGTNFDGHKFVRDAISKGARAVVSMKPIQDVQDKIPVIMVRDTYEALLQIATFLRNRFQGTVISVTGSCGKTTTKEILYSILSKSHKVSKNYKNWNNLIGVPLSIFRFKGDEDFWVLELGINVIGEMDKLGKTVTPDIVCIPNIGPVHLEGLESLTGVAREKANLLDYLSKNGVGIINKKYPELVLEASKRPGRTLFFGGDSSYTIKFKGIDEKLQGRFDVFLDKEVLNIKTNLNMGIFQENILAAICVARELGISEEDIIKGVEHVPIPEHRARWIWVGDFLILDDCYNANPLAMERVFNDLNTPFFKRPIISILGDMLELGEYSKKEHFRLGKILVDNGVDVVFYRGKFYSDVKNGILSRTTNIAIYKIDNVDNFVDKWKKLNISEGTIIVKGSRAVKLEEVLDLLIKNIKSNSMVKQY